jgi:hypothetical protein
MTSEKAKHVIFELSARNSAFYSDARGHGALKDLQQSFPHAWIYVAELIQNGVDAEAKAIRFSKTKQGVLILEHDGKEFDEKDVEGICTKGVSTKGAGTVGFMGVGFKSVFRSFQTVTISSGPWKFRLQAKVTKGEVYGDQQRDWLGTVLPMWADGATPPSEGMSCRFELSGRIEGLGEVEQDFEAVFRADEALLALLSMQGIENVSVLGRSWLLKKRRQPTKEHPEIARYRITAVDEASASERHWVLFRAEYTPSRSAVRRFLEHRQITPKKSDRDQVYAEAARCRTVDLFFPVDGDGFPCLPERGEAFALLPTAMDLPFGVHLNADWLLTVTRTELMDIGHASNPWQEELRAQIPRLIAAYLEWLGSDEGPGSGSWEIAYRVFPERADDAEGLMAWLTDSATLSALRDRLTSVAFLPSFETGDTKSFNMLTPDTGRALPDSVAESFRDKPELLPKTLFGDRVVDRAILGERASAFLTSASLLSEITAADLNAMWGKTGVKTWAGALPDESRERALCTLFDALYALPDEWGYQALTILPAESGAYTSMSEAVRLPNDWNIVVNEPAIRALLKPFLGDPRRVVKRAFDDYAKRESSWWHRVEIGQPSLDDLVSQWWDSLPEKGLASEQVDSVVAFTCWVLSKQTSRRSLVKRLLAAKGNQALKLLPCGQVVLADPYAGAHRRMLFPDAPAISDLYFRKSAKEPIEWQTFFELQASSDDVPLGRAPLVPNVRYPDADLVFEHLHIDPPATRRSKCQPKVWDADPRVQVKHACYTHVDWNVPEPIACRMSAVRTRGDALVIASWLSDISTSLQECVSQRLLYIPANDSRIAEVDYQEPASWLVALQQSPWVWAKNGTGPYHPQNVLAEHDETRPEAPVADLDPALIATLTEAGVEFGTMVAKAASLRTLQLKGALLPFDEFALLLEECLTESEDNAASQQLLRELLWETPLLPAPDSAALIDGQRRAPGKRCVQVAGTGRRRSSLDWASVISDFPSGSAEARIFSLAAQVVQFPEQVTALHCMGFLEWVWRTKPDADRVRHLLPRAYSYVMQDLEAHPEWQQQWDAVRERAVVYTLGRKWQPIRGEATVYFNDLDASTGPILPKSQLATPGHLGDSQEGVDLLRIPRLSKKFTVRLKQGEALALPPNWERHFEALRRTLRELALSAAPDNAAPAALAPTALKLVKNIHRNLTENLTGEHKASIELWAVRLHDGSIIISGDPEDFAADLCKLMLEESAAQDDEAVELSRQVSALLTILGQSRFNAKHGRLRQRLGLPDVEAPSQREQPEIALPPVGIGREEEPAQTDDNEQGFFADESGADVEGPSGTTPRRASRSGARGTYGGRPTNGWIGRSYTPGRDKDESSHPAHHGAGGGQGSHTPKDREGLLAYYLKQAALLAGCAILPREAESSDAEREAGDPPDEQYRRAVLAYERMHGRFATSKASEQPGHDIDSFTAPEGAADRRLSRRIEVKGRMHAWENGETVELSRPQFDSANSGLVEEGTACDPDFDYWLYVVEDLGEQTFKVLPIRNPARKSAKFEVRGGTWRTFAEDPAELSLSGSDEPASAGSPRPAAPGRRSILDLKH